MPLGARRLGSVAILFSYVVIPPSYISDTFFVRLVARCGGSRTRRHFDTRDASAQGHRAPKFGRTEELARARRLCYRL
jgi:hypothetical protein